MKNIPNLHKKYHPMHLYCLTSCDENNDQNQEYTYFKSDTFTFDVILCDLQRKCVTAKSILICDKYPSSKHQNGYASVQSQTTHTNFNMQVTSGFQSKNLLSINLAHCYQTRLGFPEIYLFVYRHSQSGTDKNNFKYCKVNVFSAVAEEYRVRLTLQV